MLVFYDAGYIDEIIQIEMTKSVKFHSAPIRDIVSYSIFKKILENLLNERERSALHVIFLHDAFDGDKIKAISDLFIGVKEFIQNDCDERNRIFLIKTIDQNEFSIPIHEPKNVSWEILSLGTECATDVPLELFVYESKKQDIVDCASFFDETGEITIVTNDEDTAHRAIISSKGRFSVVNARSYECNETNHT